MGFLRKIGGFFGLGHDASAATHGDDHVGDGGAHGGSTAEKDTATAPPVGRKGFSVQVPVAVDRPVVGPVLAPCSVNEGTVQGFRWYTRRLRIDEDGDVADEFLEEVTVADKQFANPPQFQTKFNTRPTALSMRKQTVARDGNILQSFDYGDDLKWV
ncbi:phospholipid hydroperoxide glutathione peroxidase [Rhynchospora pubera]|uniref:Phospholipid hydroperoxide glutathione peroxidase n=1 Tax=Rhynchospora pubera TaxID=906938 RepID=A0AAV8EKY6_9POAL|nr:phospholipid hydroperoxide glutathione peroxidase [Rhynchospora pubera]KAJ4804600.1 phospholipid hydroperoxide glutathione peroxidase [Rhynchospora pubera]